MGNSAAGSSVFRAGKAGNTGSNSHVGAFVCGTGWHTKVCPACSAPALIVQREKRKGEYEAFVSYILSRTFGVHLYAIPIAKYEFLTVSLPGA